MVTVAGAPAERKKAMDLAEVINAGERDVDLAPALGALPERGFARVLAEGGPSLNGQLAAPSLLDEVRLTLSPLLAGAMRSGSWPVPVFRAASSGGSPRCGNRTGSCSSGTARRRKPRSPVLFGRPGGLERGIQGEATVHE